MFDTENSIQKIDASYTSRVAEIFNVYLKSLGIELDFVDTEEEIRTYDDTELHQHIIDDEMYFCTDYQAFLMKRASEIRNEILSENPVLTEKVLKDMIEESMKKKKYINGELHEELGDMELSLKKEIEESYQKLLKKQMEKESEELANTLAEVSEETK